jgi:hypothetical protein
MFNGTPLHRFQFMRSRAGVFCGEFDAAVLCAQVEPQHLWISVEQERLAIPGCVIISPAVLYRGAEQR